MLSPALNSYEQLQNVLICTMHGVKLVCHTFLAAFHLHASWMLYVHVLWLLMLVMMSCSAPPCLCSALCPCHAVISNSEYSQPLDSDSNQQQ